MINIKLRDLTGQKFNFLTVISRADNINGRVAWNCKCLCGESAIVRGGDLTGDHTKSCGCIQESKYGELYGTRIYRIHEGMKQRCYNENCEAYTDYGGRGIVICKRWLDDNNGLINFYDWSMKNGYSEELTIDRINVNGNYTPENCRWATKKEQQNNTRTNHYITINGVTKTLSQWAEESGVGYKTISYRVNKGLSGTDLIKVKNRK